MENSNKKDGFIFYQSFYDSINSLDASMQLEVYQALAEYGLTGEMREDLSPVTVALLKAMIPTIDNANKRYQASVENGKKGGRPKKNKETQEEKPKNLEKPSNNLEQPRKNLKKPSNNLDTSRLPSGKPNRNPSVSVSVYDTDTEYKIKDKRYKIKDKTVAVRQVNYITEILFDKSLITDDEVEFIDDIICSNLSTTNAVDLKCKCEYVLKEMKSRKVKDRLSYFKSSLENELKKELTGSKDSPVITSTSFKHSGNGEGMEILAKYD